MKTGRFIDRATDQPLTAGQLIERLKEVPPDLVVCVEGCDCLGVANDVSVSTDPYYEGVVIIGRQG